MFFILSCQQLHSEYRSTYRWHEYHPQNASQIIRRPPQSGVAGESLLFIGVVKNGLAARVSYSKEAIKLERRKKFLRYKQSAIRDHDVQFPEIALIPDSKDSKDRDDKFTPQHLIKWPVNRLIKWPVNRLIKWPVSR